MPWDASYKDGRAPWNIGDRPDCGLFHTFNADERPDYVASLASVTIQRLQT